MTTCLRCGDFVPEESPVPLCARCPRDLAPTPHRYGSVVGVQQRLALPFLAFFAILFAFVFLVVRHPGALPGFAGQAIGLGLVPLAASVLCWHAAQAGLWALPSYAARHYAPMKERLARERGLDPARVELVLVDDEGRVQVGLLLAGERGVAVLAARPVTASFAGGDASVARSWLTWPPRTALRIEKHLIAFVERPGYRENAARARELAARFEARS